MPTCSGGEGKTSSVGVGGSTSAGNGSKSSPPPPPPLRLLMVLPLRGAALLMSHKRMPLLVRVGRCRCGP